MGVVGIKDPVFDNIGLLCVSDTLLTRTKGLQIIIVHVTQMQTTETWCVGAASSAPSGRQTVDIGVMG